MIRIATAIVFLSLLGTPALATEPAKSAKPERVEYKNSWERLQGAPYVRAQRARAASETRGSSAGEVAMERIPQGQFSLEGRTSLGAGTGF